MPFQLRICTNTSAVHDMSEVLKAAKDGDIKALEVLMNKSFNPKGVTVRITKTGSILKVTLSAAAGPDQRLANLIKTGLHKIKPQGFEKVFVTARTTNPISTVWTTQWKMIVSEGKEQSSISLQQAKPPISRAQTPEKKRANQLTHRRLGLVLGVTTLVVLGGALFSHVVKNSLSGVESFKGVASPLLLEIQNIQPSLPDRSYEVAIKQALVAVDESKTAVSLEEWENATSLWRQAIFLMEKVPESNENYAKAQVKVSEYQSNFQEAQKRSVALIPPTLGASKASLRADFSQSGIDFSFENSPLSDGTPRLLGKSPDGLILMELYGDTEYLTRATLTTFIGKGVPADLLAIYNVAFLSKVAPGYAWNSELADSIDEFSKLGTGEKRIRAGDNLVEMSLQEVSGVSMFFVAVEPR